MIDLKIIATEDQYLKREWLAGLLAHGRARQLNASQMVFKTTSPGWLGTQLLAMGVDGIGSELWNEIRECGTYNHNILLGANVEYTYEVEEGTIELWAAKDFGNCQIGAIVTASPNQS